jgi:23S rRNA pseudouridine1911/1915/1917 synthase
MKFSFTTNRKIRAERFCSEALPFIRRGFLQKLFRKKEIKVAGKPVKADSDIPAGSKVEIFLPDAQKNFGLLTGCEILFEDKDLIAFNKRSGITMHAGVATHGNTLREAAEKLLKLSLVVVHRIDKATSGVVIFAKNANAARKLEDEFRKRRVKKTYYAVVEGIPRETEGEIISKLEKHDKQMRISEKGFSAETHWKLVKKLEKRALLEVKILTGRMHQIRIHLASIGFPVVGDEIYGNGGSGRMLLHASDLEILKYKFHADLPQEFEGKE